MSVSGWLSTELMARARPRLPMELAHELRSRGRFVVRVSVDDFHHVKAHRYRRGRESCNPAHRADLVVDNSKPEAPELRNPAEIPGCGGLGGSAFD